MRRIGPRALLSLLPVMACDAAAPVSRGPVDLVVATAWELAPEHEDLFADQRPALIECEPGRGYTIEERPQGPVFEVNTGWCNYITVAQPLLHPLHEGDEIEVRVWHFELSSPEPGDGFVGIGLGGEVVWSATVEIPSDSGPVHEVFTAPADVDAGDPIQFHIHNHGYNAWEIVSIVRL